MDIKMKDKKSIETSNLTIKGNLLTWEGTMLQLSNISCISAANLREEKFPIIALAILLIGAISIFQAFLAGLLFIAIGAGWIYLRYHINESRRLKAFLNITMNSGDQLSFLFDNKDFLLEVLDLLETIITEGGIGEQNINIDMHGCSISDNAHVFTDSKIGVK